MQIFQNSEQWKARAVLGCFEMPSLWVCAAAAIATVAGSRPARSVASTIETRRCRRPDADDALSVRPSVRLTDTTGTQTARVPDPTRPGRYSAPGTFGDLDRSCIVLEGRPPARHRHRRRRSIVVMRRRYGRRREICEWVCEIIDRNRPRDGGRRRRCRRPLDAMYVHNACALDSPWSPGLRGF